MGSESVEKILQRVRSGLPGPDAGLRELIAFCQKNDPSPAFRERWGDAFRERVRELWAASTHAFKGGRATGYGPGEVLMCMAHDVSVAPYIGVPPEVSQAYLQAMLRELRASLE